MTRNRPEDEIQRAVVQHLHIRGAPGTFWFAVPNGGFRRRVEAAILKGLGLRSGVPDLVFVQDGCAFALELKTETGRLTEAQEQALIALREAGAIATHTNGLDQALRMLEAWGLLRGHAA